MLKRKYRADILFSRTNFTIGMGSVLNIAGKYFEFNRSNSGLDADRLALMNDWGVVADDLKAAMHKASKKKNLIKL